MGVRLRRAPLPCRPLHRLDQCHYGSPISLRPDGGWHPGGASVRGYPGDAAVQPAAVSRHPRGLPAGLCRLSGQLPADECRLQQLHVSALVCRESGGAGLDAVRSHLRLFVCRPDLHPLLPRVAPAPTTAVPRHLSAALLVDTARPQWAVTRLCVACRAVDRVVIAGQRLLLQSRALRLVPR